MTQIQFRSGDFVSPWLPLAGLETTTRPTPAPRSSRRRRRRVCSPYVEIHNPAYGPYRTDVGVAEAGETVRIRPPEGHDLGGKVEVTYYSDHTLHIMVNGDLRSNLAIEKIEVIGNELEIELGRRA